MLRHKKNIRRQPHDPLPPFSAKRRFPEPALSLHALYARYRHRAVGEVRIWAGCITAVLVGVAGIAVAIWVPGYRLSGNGIASIGHGMWLTNYGKSEWTFVAPLAGAIGALVSAFCAAREQRHQAFIASGVGVAGVSLTAGESMFPFIMPSSTHIADSLTIWNATSSRLTLQIMLIAVLIFLPIVLLYTTWVYRVMRGAYR